MRSKKIKALITVALTVNIASNLITPALAEEIVKQTKEEIIILQEDKDSKESTEEEKEQKIKEIRVNKKVLDVGEKINFSLKLENNTTDKIIFEYLDEENTSLKIDFKYNKENERYESDFKIEKEQENKILRLNKILIDENGKIEEYKQENIKREDLTLKINKIQKEEPKKEEVKESSDKKDEVKEKTDKENKEPKKETIVEKDKEEKQQNDKEYGNDVVKSIAADKEVAKLNEKIKVSVEIDESKEKVREVKCEYVVNKKQGSSTWEVVSLEYNSKNKKYEGEIEVTKEFLSAEISLEEIRFVTDTISSGIEYVGHKGIKIITTNSNGVIDEKAPIIKSATIDKKEAKIGEYVNLSVDAIDEEGSELEVFCYYNWMKGEQWFNELVKLEYNSKTKRYEGKVKITEMMAKAKVDFRDIRATDEVGNTGYLENYEYDKYRVQIADENGVIDKNPPIIKSAQVSKNEAKLNDEIVVSVEAEDKESSIRNIRYNYSYIDQSGESQWSELELKLSNTKKRYEGKIKITEDMLKGKITPSGINAIDEFQNEIYYYDYDYEKMIISVADKNGVIDKNPPIIKSAQVSKNEAKLNDEILVSVEANDKESSIKQVIYGYSYVNQQGEEYSEELDLKLNSVTKKYEGKIKITEDMIKSKISPNRIEARDDFGNEMYYSDYDYEKMIIWVAGEDGIIDCEEPVIEGIKVSKTEAKVGEKVKISVEASDFGGSGVDRVNYCYYIGEEYDELKLNFNKITKMYEGEIEITKNMSGKKIIPDYVEVYDKWNNETTEFLYDSKLIVHIANEQGIVDKIAPAVKNFMVDRTEAKLGDKIKFSLEANDKETGVEKVSVAYEVHEEGGIIEHTELQLKYNEKTKKYEGNIAVTEELLKSRIQVIGVFVKDKAQNITEIQPMTSIWIADKNGVVDKVAPIIKRVNINKEKAKVGEEIKIEVEASDAKSKIMEVGVGIISEDFNDCLALEYNTATKKYEGKYTVPSEAEGNYIALSEVICIDEFGNQGWQDLRAQFKVHIEDVKGNVNDKPIKIEELIVDKTKVKVGDKVNISLRVDNPSIYDQVNFHYRADGVKSENIFLVYSEDKKCYEGSFTITDNLNGLLIEYEAVASNGNGNRHVVTSTDLGKHIQVEKDVSIKDDNNIPILKSIKTDKQEYKENEIIKFTLDIQDESRIKKISTDNYGNLRFKYNQATKLYEATMEVNEWMVGREEQIQSIQITDVNNNTAILKNGEVKLPKIRVLGENNKVDTELPKLVKSSVSSNNVSYGTEVKVTVEATDSLSGIMFVNYEYDDSEETKIVYLNYNEQSKKYEGMIYTENYIDGDTLNNGKIVIGDRAGNNAVFINKTNLNIKVRGENDRIRENKKIIKNIELDKNITSRSEKIKLSVDLDVKPEEIKRVSIDSFIHNTDSAEGVYELIYNEKTKKYEAEISTNEIVKYKRLFAITDIKIIFKDGRIQNRNIFSQKDLCIGYNKEITGWQEFGGKVYTKNGKVVKGSQVIDGLTYKFDEYGNLLGKENNKPVIHAIDKILNLGEKFNPMEGIKANDLEDGNITSKVKIISNNVDIKKAGTYYVKYEVEDSVKLKVTKTIKVTVLSEKSDFKNNWAEKYIKKAMQNEWVATTDKFRPEDSITRAEFIKIVNRCFGYKEKAGKENFKDVAEKDWFYDDVKIALKAGYISSELERFRPHDNISREEAAAIITAITKTRDNKLDKLEKYKDKNKVSDWAKSSVEGVIEKGYMGRGSDMFRPKSNITRAEAVVTLGRIK